MEGYRAPPTVAQFMQDDSFVRQIIGPLGSSKSSGCANELLRRSIRQRRSPNGKRRSRWAVVRNTYRELLDTTKRTIEEWIPAEIRDWSTANASYIIRFNDVEAEIMLRALDTPEDVGKLLSLELTGAWINESKEIEKAVVDALTGRVGRFPRDAHDWSGIWMDTNAPDSDHWIYLTFEEERPDGYRIFHQPSGLAVNAENVENLLGGQKVQHPQYGLIPLYYARMLAGKTKEWIDVFVHGKYGFVKDGKPVYAEYSDEVHSAKEVLIWSGGKLTLGMDFGLTPAIIVLDRTPSLQWRALKEYVSTNMGASRFSEYVASDIRTSFPNADDIEGWGDPAGSTRSQVDERTPYDVVQAAGLPIHPAHSNDPVLRREAVANCLTTLTITSVPALIISPACRVLRKAMNGGYHYKRIQVSGSSRFKDTPEKNHFSHIAEALQYALLGAGMDGSAIGVPQDRIVTPKVKMAMPTRRGHGPG